MVQLSDEWLLCGISELTIQDIDIARVLVDTRCSANIIYKSTLERMEIDLCAVTEGPIPIFGLSGYATMTLGSIDLVVKAGSVIKVTEFLVIDRPTSYNAIVGTPWLNSMRAIASTFHLCLKFPTPRGVETIQGDRRMSQIGANLREPLKTELIACLKKNLNAFAWAAEDMPGIDIGITCHELNIDPTYIPVKQKRRKLGPECATAVNEEVERLLKPDQ
ncbi:PREDICTED: uncharacterized protein LOC106314792 [Brassica oleracea var. oleracea]|uniref:uncharacterized protein LOC106314792 n=1 Tax=Brassica oleracea var. oleracea TaxID=109376 RepID=UPI0006A6AFE0|nr:PREDICTED: uncharacterized protein LOC106314792 [Brassica oleracea var. oleracea]